MHASGTIYAATREVPVPGDDGTLTLTVLTRPYPKLILNDIVIVHQLTELFSGVDLPSITTIELDNSEGTFDPNPASDWRQTPVIIKWLDSRALSGSNLRTEFSGIIADMQFKPGRAIMTVTSIDQAILATLIPKVVVSTFAWPDAQGLGKAVPVVGGTGALVRPPNVGTPNLPSIPDDTEGSDFIVSHIPAGSTVSISSVFTDQDSERPGLERWPSSTWDELNNTVYPGYVALRMFESSEFGCAAGRDESDGHRRGQSRAVDPATFSPAPPLG